MNFRRKLCYSAVTLFLMLVLSEITLKLIDFEYDRIQEQTRRWIENSNQALSHDGWFRRLQALGQQFDPVDRPDWFLTHDAIRLWKTRAPNLTFGINEQGFRGHPVEIPKPADEYRILILGDSVAWGYKSDIRETYAHRLEMRLNDKSDTVFRVINAGIPGYSSEQGRLYFEQDLAYLEPHLVIVSFGRNDYRYKPEQWQGLTDRELIEKRSQTSRTVEVLRIFHTFQFVEFLVDQAMSILPDALQVESRYPEFTYHNVEMDLENSFVRVPEHDFRENILAMHRIARCRDADFVLMTIPVNPQVVGNYNYVLKELSKERGIPLIDMNAVFQEQNDYPNLLIDECHLTAAGHEIFAQNLEKAVREIAP